MLNLILRILKMINPANETKHTEYKWIPFCNLEPPKSPPAHLSYKSDGAKNFKLSKKQTKKQYILPYLYTKVQILEIELVN